MNRRTTFLIVLLAALAVGGGIFFFRSGTPAPPPGTDTVAADSGAAAQAPEPRAATTTPGGAAAQTTTGNAPAASTAGAYDPEQDDGQVAFRADEWGQLVTNEKTRLDIERLYALYGPQERAKKLQEVSANLPPDAARRLRELMDQYPNYQAAVYQAYPPDREMTTVEQGVSQIDGMHGLRVQFFGEDATRAMFGDEEKAQREIYKLMENEKDPGLSLQQKAERAQQLYQQQQR